MRGRRQTGVPSDGLWSLGADLGPGCRHLGETDNASYEWAGRKLGWNAGWLLPPNVPPD
jgi:hypothetical protein